MFVPPYQWFATSALWASSMKLNVL